jgi:hypothetical protein
MRRARFSKADMIYRPVLMTSLLTWLEAVVGNFNLPVLEVWGRFSHLVGFVFAICAFGGFTFRLGERWGFGRERSRSASSRSRHRAEPSVWMPACLRQHVLVRAARVIAKLVEVPGRKDVGTVAAKALYAPVPI